MGKKGGKAQVSRRHQRRRSRRWLFYSVAMGLVGVIVLVVSLTTGTGSPQQKDSPQAQLPGPLPGWLARAPFIVRDAYAYAAANPQPLSYIPCYCGCGVHDGHRSAYNCFYKGSDGTELVYDQHGANCAMCVDIALMTQKMLAQGRSLAEAKQAVVQKYSSLGPPTNTPPLPLG